MSQHKVRSASYSHSSPPRSLQMPTRQSQTSFKRNPLPIRSLRKCLAVLVVVIAGCFGWLAWEIARDRFPTLRARAMQYQKALRERTVDVQRLLDMHADPVGHAHAMHNGHKLADLVQVLSVTNVSSNGYNKMIVAKVNEPMCVAFGNTISTGSGNTVPSVCYSSDHITFSDGHTIRPCAPLNRQFQYHGEVTRVKGLLLMPVVPFGDSFQHVMQDSIPALATMMQDLAAIQDTQGQDDAQQWKDASVAMLFDRARAGRSGGRSDEEKRRDEAESTGSWTHTLLQALGFDVHGGHSDRQGGRVLRMRVAGHMVCADSAIVHMFTPNFVFGYTPLRAHHFLHKYFFPASSSTPDNLASASLVGQQQPSLRRGFADSLIPKLQAAQRAANTQPSGQSADYNTLLLDNVLDLTSYSKQQDIGARADAGIKRTVLYLERKGQLNGRNVVNGEQVKSEVVRWSVEHSFRLLAVQELGNLAKEDVASLFHDVDAVIGVHGGALCNLLFMRAGRSAVLEIQVGGKHARSFEPMATSHGIVHKGLMASCIESSDDDLSDQSDGSNHGDGSTEAEGPLQAGQDCSPDALRIRVDLGELRQSLESLAQMILSFPEGQNSADPM